MGYLTEAKICYIRAKANSHPVLIFFVSQSKESLRGFHVSYLAVQEGTSRQRPGKGAIRKIPITKTEVGKLN